MSSGSGSLQVKKVLKSIVDKVVCEFDNIDESAVEPTEPVENGLEAGDSEVRRSARARKEPDRLDTKPTDVIKKIRQKPVKLEIVMDPAPPDLRGILKKARAPFPPPRKSSLTATAGKAIASKYRKVRVSRRLQYKVIPPLPGWRSDRTRMPEDEPDEEEQKRLEQQEEKEKEKQEAQRKKRKRKSIGVPISSVSDDDATVGTEEISRDVDSNEPSSPDVFYEDYIKVNSPDSVLASDGETEERREEARRPAPKTLFPTIEESPEDRQTTVTVVKESGDTVAPDPKKKERRRSVRIQPPEEEKPKTVERKERRKSKMFPVTPAKEESPVVVEKKEKSVRRKSGVIRMVSAAKKEEEEAASTSRNPKGPVFYPGNRYGDVPCETQKEGVAMMVHNQRAKSDKSDSLEKVPAMGDQLHKTDKVAAWLARPDAAAADPATYPADDTAAAAGRRRGGELPESTLASSGGKEEIESVRGAAAREVQLTEEERSSGSSKKRLVEASTSAQPQSKLRKGRRSMMVAREVGKEGGDKEWKEEKKGESGKENEELPSTSKSSEESEKKKKKEQQAHPFFAKFAPKPSPTVAEKKQPAAVGRRRSMFVPKKSLAAKRESPPVEKRKEKKSKKKEEDEESGEEEDAIEIVGEVKKGKEETREERGATSRQPGEPSHAAIWRSTEIDAAPYGGLVHVGREKEEAGGEEEKEGEEGVVRKMRRLSVRLPRLSSYSIPLCLRSPERAAETMPVFDNEREYDHSERASALSKRAARHAADADAVAWPEAVRPRTVEECLGDREVLASGKRWLQKWKKRLDAACAEEEKATKAPKVKRKKRKGGNYSDESEAEDSDSDYELREEECRLPNPLLLSGPIGCGKSAYLCALSAECGFSILESAPDERRAGSNLRAKLAGAVANYRMSSKPAGGIASFFSPKSGGEEKKKEEKERKGRQHTLVVIEHVDVVFAEEDKLFWPALAEILATTKIPIALTCNVIPDELSRVLEQAEEGGGTEHLEMTMGRGGGVEEYVEASLAGCAVRTLSATVIPAIVARARSDLRAALHDAHWAAAGEAIGKTDLVDARARRVDAPAACDRAATQSFAWRDACAHRAERIGDSEMSRAALWPARGGMAGEVYARLCTQIDEIDQDAARAAEERATRMMEMARSGVGAGNKGRTGLLTRREIAEDWMPLLEQIDRREQVKRKEYGRRHQHYFNVIKDLESGLSIDPLDRIRGACGFFRLPQTD